MKENDLSETQNYMLSELNNLFKLICKKKKNCDY